MNQNLHQAQSHQVSRAWQSKRNEINHPVDFILPLFICQDDNAIEPISSMPDVNRYGCNKVLEYLEPLVEQYHLQSVLLFPVPAKEDVSKIKEKLEDMSASLHLDNGRIVMNCAQGNMEDEMQLYGELDSVSSDDLSGSASSSGLETTNKKNPFRMNGNEEEHDQLLLSSNGSGADATSRLISEGLAKSTISQNQTERFSNGTKKSTAWTKVMETKLVKWVAMKQDKNPVLRLLPLLKARFPQLMVLCDVCICAFTSTGHCCVFEDEPDIDDRLGLSRDKGDRPMLNKLTCELLAELSYKYVQLGCDMIAPSDMMDGRIAAIRKRLDAKGFNHISIMSYSAKFSSAFYGPFRQATDNVPQFGDRRAYQLPPGSRTLAQRAVDRDIEQGADFIMVKPGLAYIDIIRDIANAHPEVPVSVYQVSGEYSMLKMSAKAGLIDYKRAVNETLTSFRRAGASIIITYFTPEILRGEL